MAFEVIVNGKTRKFVLEAIEPALARGRPGLPDTGTKVVVHRVKRTGREFEELISADLSGIDEAQVLKPGEFYLRDYNQRELVDGLVEQELIEPVVDYSPVQSGYVNFWVYRITSKGLEHTIRSIE